MKLKKILFITEDINYGGAGKIISFIANGLSELGNSIIIHTYAGNNSFYDLNKEIIYIPPKKIRRTYMSKLSYFIDIRRMIKKVNPDIVISFLPIPNMLSVIGTALTKIPVIISERSDPYTEKGFLLNFAKSLFKYADGAVFQTKDAKEYYSESLQKKSIVIPNPVTIGKAERIPFKKRNNEIAFVARFFVKQKRQDIMLNAFKIVADHNKDVNLVFYGDGPDLKIIKQMVNDMNLTDRVWFRGEVKNIEDKIKNSRIFVLTSDYEGIPNALIEAMSVGLPVVSTDCSPGGARILIEDKKNGLIVPTRDVNGIAKAILFLLENHEIAEQYGIEAQKIIEKYSPEKILKIWDEFVDKVIKFNHPNRDYLKGNRKVNYKQGIG